MTLTYRDELEQNHSDTFKDLHGVRPRHSTAHMSDADLVACIAGMSNHMWQVELSEVSREAGQELSFQAIGRMTIDEITHRISGLRALPRNVSSGAGWAVV